MATDERAPTGLGQTAAERPRWALPALLIGIGCSLVIAWGSIDSAAGQAEGEGPSSMVYTMRMTPFLLVGVPTMLAGAWGVVRPWSRRRPWLPWTAVGAGVLWFLLVLGGPGLAAPDTTGAGSATVVGLPDQVAPWSGVVECERVGAAIGTVRARVPVDRAGGTTTFGIDLILGDGDPTMIIGDAATGGGSYVSADRFESGDEWATGTMVAAIPGILHRDAPTSVVTVTWECEPTPAAP